MKQHTHGSAFHCAKRVPVLYWGFLLVICFNMLLVSVGQAELTHRALIPSVMSATSSSDTTSQSTDEAAINPTNPDDQQTTSPPPDATATPSTTDQPTTESTVVHNTPPPALDVSSISVHTPSPSSSTLPLIEKTDGVSDIPSPLTTQSTVPPSTPDENIQVTTIEIESTTTRSDATITPTPSTPANVPTPSLTENQKVLSGYYTITPQSTPDSTVLASDFTSMTVTFAVSKTLLEQDHIDKNSIRLISYEAPRTDIGHTSPLAALLPPSSPKTWEQLTPTFVSEDDTHLFYQVVTHHRITTVSFVGIVQIDIQSSNLDLLEIPWAAIIMFIVIASLVLTLVFFKSGCIYFDEDKPAEEPINDTHAITVHHHLRSVIRKPVRHSKLHKYVLTMKIFMHFFIAIIF